MTHETSAPAQRVRESLAAHGIAWDIVELPSTARTAKETAGALGCRIEQVVKSLVFLGTATNEPILVLARGSNRVNERTLSALVSEPVQIADAEFVQQRTGFTIGSVPPVGHRQRLVTLVDEGLLQFEGLWAGTGVPNTVCYVRPTDLVAASGGRVVSIT